MVRKGEYLERAVVIPGGEHPIEGLFHRGTKKPPLLIAPQHPSAGSMEAPIVAELAWAATRAGHSTLRFNYRGAGASGGTFDEAGALTDARLAADHLRSCAGVAPLALLGIGFGAEVMAKLARESDVPLVLLVAPDPARLDLEGVAGDVVALCAEMEDPPIKEALARAVKTRGRLAVIPRADRAFLRGLVELGRVVAESISPPGMIDLE